MNMEDVILSITCNEPEGTKVRHIRPLILSRENLIRLYESYRGFRNVMNVEHRNDFNRFASLFLEQEGNKVGARGLIWVVDDFTGIFYLTDVDINPGAANPISNATAHYIFFDRRHKGRELLVKAMIRWVFEQLHLRRITVKVPLYATDSTFTFVEKALGFKKEGRIRRALWFDNKWFDVNIYGLLAEEANGS